MGAVALRVSPPEIVLATYVHGDFTISVTFTAVAVVVPVFFTVIVKVRVSPYATVVAPDAIFVIVKVGTTLTAHNASISVLR